jgi:glycerol-3-phosphate acyltransferase PlsY
VTRRSSLGALVALPAVVLLTGWCSPGDLPWAFALAVLVLLRHIANIRRLLSGTELSLSDSSAQEPPVS